MNRSDTLQSTAIVTLGNIIFKAIAFLSTIILIKFFTPSDYGLIVTYITILSTLPVLMDFGTSASIIRFIPALDRKGKTSDITKILRAVFKLRFFSGLIWFLIGVGAAKYLAIILFKDVNNSFLIILALLGAICVSFFQYIITILQVYQNYILMVMIQLGDNVLKLTLIISVVICCSSQFKSPITISGIYATVPLLTIIIILILKRDLLKYFKFKNCYLKDSFSTLISFSFWYLVSSVSIMIFMNFDIYILAYFKSSREVGYFGAGYKLASVLWIVVHALNTVLLPTAGRCNSRKELIRFIKNSIKFCLLISLAIIPVTIAAPFIVRTLGGLSYEPSILIFKIVAWDHIVMIAFTPMMITLFLVNRPRLMALISVIQMSMNIMGDILFVPQYGGVGAALVTLFVRISIGISGSIYLFIRIKKDNSYIRQVDLLD